MASANIRNFRKNNIVTPTDYNLAFEQVENILEFIRTQTDRQNALEDNIASLMHKLEFDKNNEDLKIEIKDAIAYAEQNKKLFDGIIKGFELYKVQNKIDQYNAKDWQAMERKAQKEFNNNKEWKAMEEQAQKEVNNNAKRGKKPLVYSTPSQNLNNNKFNNNEFYKNENSSLLHQYLNNSQSQQHSLPLKKNTIKAIPSSPLTKKNTVKNISPEQKRINRIKQERANFKIRTEQLKADLKNLKEKLQNNLITKMNFIEKATKIINILKKREQLEKNTKNNNNLQERLRKLRS